MTREEWEEGDTGGITLKTWPISKRRSLPEIGRLRHEKVHRLHLTWASQRLVYNSRPEIPLLDVEGQRLESTLPRGLPSNFPATLLCL